MARFVHVIGQIVIRRFIDAYARRPCADGVMRPLAAIGLALVFAIGAALDVAAQGRPLKLVAFGDSLTAGYNLPAAAAFPAQLQQALAARGRAVIVENAGVSGDTAQSGLDRLDWSVGEDVDGVILELGANDALRGLDPAQTETALEGIILRLRQRAIPVMIAGMRAPPNMGQDYARRFDALFGQLAARHGLVIYPFFLDGVAGQPQLNQRDGIHPTADGVKVIVERIVPTVEAFIATLPPRS